MLDHMQEVEERPITGSCQCPPMTLRGIDTVAAITLVAELAELKRFAIRAS